MAKKNITKIGTQIAFAAAMTAALAMPANADEIDETPVQSEPAPVVADPAPAASSTNVQEVSSHNASVSESNNEAVQENNDTASSNESTASSNDSAASSNNSVPSDNGQTGGNNDEVVEDNQEIVEDNSEKVDENTQLPEIPEAPVAPEAPVLPEAPEVPVAPETPELDETDPEEYNKDAEDYNGEVDDYNEQVDDYNEKAEDYNEAAGAYNDKVDDYNEAAGEYNEKVEDYNEAVDEVNKNLQDQYKEDLEQWEEEKADREQEQADFDAREAEHKAKVEAYEKLVEDYKELYKQWETDHKLWEERKDAHEAQHGTKEEYDQLMKEYTDWQEECKRLTTEYENKVKEYEKYLAEKAAYDAYLKDKETFEQKEDRKDIYDEVVEYNGQVESDNAAIEEANKNLGLGLNAGGTLEEIAESNADLDAKLAESEEGQKLLETLSKENRDKLAAGAAALATEAAALDEEANKDYQLGTEAYATYLQRVKDFNEAVKNYNKALKEYNDAVTEYNKQVDTFNAANVPQQGEANTGNGTQQEEGKEIDWGNVVFGEYDGILTHMDVKYNAAASKSVDENGEYSENVTQYTVTGVYAKQGDKKYGLAYSNDGWKTSTEQTLSKDASNDEFGNTLNNHLGEELDPVNGEIRFFVTLTDSNGKTHEIEVTLDSESVYAEGSFYKPEKDFWGNESDFLDRYVGAGGKKLEKVLIDGEYYYDISGESVYLISALTCDGMSEETKKVGTGKYATYEKTGNLTAHGLDLILNMQTIIEIYQAENTQKLIYNQGYLMGKTATATDPGDPGKAPDKVNPPTKVVEEPELNLPGFGKDIPGKFNPFTEEEPDAPDPVDPSLKPDPFTEVRPEDYSKEKPVLVQLSTLDTIEELKKLDVLNPIDYLNNKLDYKMILVIPEVVPEEEPVWFGGDAEIEEEAPWFVEVANNGLVQIIDEAVPLADAPNTGDATAMLGFASLFSFSGLYLTGNKKRRRN